MEQEMAMAMAMAREPSIPMTMMRSKVVAPFRVATAISGNTRAGKESKRDLSRYQNGSQTVAAIWQQQYLGQQKSEEQLTSWRGYTGPKF